MTTFIKPNFENSLNTLEKTESQNLVNYSGVGNERLPEIKPEPYNTGNSVRLNGKTNAIIDIASDAPTGPLSGRGGLGESGTATIDLVAGIGGSSPIDIVSGRAVQSVKSFEIDSARIYVSQKTDIDEHLGLAPIKIKLINSELPTQGSTGYSAVAVKSDVIRLVARDNIIITTMNNGTLSTGNSANPNGIDIIAGYYNTGKRASLQPMVRGNSLVNFIEDIVKNIQELQTLVENVKNEQMKINRFLAQHTHEMRTYSQTNIPSDVEKKMNPPLASIEDLTSKFIQKYIGSDALAKKYITITSPDCVLSAYNRVN
jgi:hypothetical protein